jgi:modification methylase
MQDLGFWILNDVVWVKDNPMPNFRGVRLTNAHEILIWAVKDRRRKDYTFNYREMKKQNQGKQMRSDWYFPLCTGTERLKDSKGKKLHSTQKPLALLERVIQASTNEDDIVLDPFCGTGTTGVAAKLCGRLYILIDSDGRYVKGARQRLDDLRGD